MASGQWRALAEQFQVICPPGGAPGAGSPGVLRGRASCGHWVSAAGLRGWVRALLDQGVTLFRCPCCPDTPWLWQELCKLGLFSDEDQAMLEAQILAQEGARDNYRQCPLQAVLYDTLEIQAPGSSVHGCPSLRACPECHTLVSHTGLGCPLVECPECWTEFCYRCLRDHLGEDADETEWEHDEDEDLDYDNSLEASCSIAGRQELNRSP
ncbi:uncharacterized protein LOC117869485 isoform X2 [Trachemys scripta elegans]|uniref:uncharacterized protein LOC117869485 isoform X2 n=1 Tax=Trachemys scripta elegans TaxID=31138 RepID=UPI001554ED9E|nr:uncharacterized protein LOC117869485 isoform X2 [Trachemys scripta elegans]